MENTIKSVDTVFHIVELLKSNDGATASELMDEFDVSRSTAYRHLRTLESHGYAIREGDTYHLGLRFVEMAQYSKQRKGAYEIAEGVTETLAAQSGDRASFVVEENGLGIVLAVEIGEHGLFADISVGQRFHLHASAVGKAILARYPRNRVEAIVDQHGLERKTERTITTCEALFEDLDATRERGYAINYAERIDGVRAVAVAVEDEDDNVIGAFGVSGSSRRLTEERLHGELPDILLSLAEEFTLRNRYSEPR